MQENLIFVIGSPRSGSTMLQRILGSHKEIFTHPEPHIITPLAHLGYFNNIDKAPYDHINAAEAIREFVDDLPSKEDDYLSACRAYTDILYGKMLKTTDCGRLLDKTPAYALVLPFLAKLYPKAKYIVLTRHPLAVLSSYANSFFEGDYDAAIAFNNILGRYIPAMANFLRSETPSFHIRYEDLVSSPEEKMSEIFKFLELADDPNAVNYGEHRHVEKSYGDPKINDEKRPVTKSIDSWAYELGGDRAKLTKAQSIIEPLSEQDIAQCGYDKDTLFDRIDEIQPGEKNAGKKKKKWKWNSYRIKRKVFMRLRKNIHTSHFGKMVKKIKYYCDVLLR